MHIFMAGDHAATDLLSHVAASLKTKHDVSVVTPSPDDAGRINYPTAADAVCDKVKGAARGILICGSGIGISMAANRHPHIRAALCHEPLSAALSREHNNANVLCLGARLIGTTMADAIIEAFLNTDFAGGRHTERLALFSD